MLQQNNLALAHAHQQVDGDSGKAYLVTPHFHLQLGALAQPLHLKQMLSCPLKEAKYTFTNVSLGWPGCNTFLPAIEELQQCRGWQAFFGI